jgi:PTS system galactitol-specific IIC component
MQVINSFIEFLQQMGAQAIMPVFIIIIGLVIRVPLKDLIKAALTVAVGFIGMFAMMGILGSSIAPSVASMAEKMGLQLTALDVGWTVPASFAWAYYLAPVVFLLTFGVNIVMILLGWTRTLNVDVWNFHNFMFAAAVIDVTTGNTVLALAAAVITNVTALLMADWAYKLTEKDYPGISFAHAFTVYWIPLSLLLNKLWGIIPGVKKVQADPETLIKKFGNWGDPMFIGFILGFLITLVAGLGVQAAILTGLSLAAVMLLLPKMVAYLMEGVSVIATRIQEVAEGSKLLRGKELLIGVDGGLLIGRPGSIVMGVVMVPIVLVIAFILPGNKTIPMGDLAVLYGLWQWTVICAKDNVFRGILSATVISALTLWIASDFAPAVTLMAEGVGYALPAGMNQITALALGNEIIPWLFYRLALLF